MSRICDKEAIVQLSIGPDKGEQLQFRHSGAGAINANTGGGTQNNHNNSGRGNQYNAEKQAFHQSTNSTSYGPQSNSGSINYNFGTGTFWMPAVVLLIAVLALLLFPHYSPPQPFPSEIFSSPSIIIPFRRDRDFVDRVELDDVRKRSSRPGARVGLVGLGGVGKSQLAIEYAYRVREEQPQTWVFWVHASSVARFEDSYRKIAKRLQLNEWNDPATDVLGLVYAWLSDESHGEWKMIVDNADDAETIFEPWNGGTVINATNRSTDRSMSEYLPESPNGSILITSRFREVIEGLDVSNEDIINLNPLETEVAEKLLLTKLKKSEQEVPRETVVRLVQYLECFPLAIAQAASYINQRTPRVTVARYVEILETNDDERIRLLQKAIRDPRRDGRASNSIITTWYISFEHLRQTRDSAARLLALMSLFDREAIPDYLLQGHYEEGTDGGQTDFEDDLALLRAYSLINIGMDEHSFNMHRLVQLSTQKWLEMRTELQGWQERYIDILGAAFPTGEYTNWATCQALFPHVEAMERYRVTDINQLQVWARTLYNGAWYAMTRGQYALAARMTQANLEACEETLVINDDMILGRLNMLASVLHYQGKYEQAEAMIRRVLAESGKLLGVDHPDTLTSMSNLAVILQYQRKYEEAEAINQQALAGREKVLGIDHPNTLTSMSILAGILQDQQKYKQAEAINLQVLAGREKELGIDHPDTLASMNNLAVVLQYQGKYNEAEAMIRQALAGKEKVLGVNHADTLTSMYVLASVLRSQGKYEEAEAMNRRALAGREKELGVDHPDTLASMNDLALVLQY